MIKIHTDGRASWLNHMDIIQIMGVPGEARLGSKIRTAMLIGHNAKGESLFIFADESVEQILEMMLSADNV